MKIAFTTKGTEWTSEMDARFGRTEFLLVFDTETKELTSFDNSAIQNEAHGAGNKTSQTLYELKANVLITGNGPGGNASKVLERTGVEIFIGAGDMTVEQAYKAYQENKLDKF